MEINEKLDIFFQSAIAAANEESETSLEEQRRICSESLAEYGKMRQAQSEKEVRLMRKRVEKEINRSVAEAVMQLKREYHGRIEQCRQELFALVEEKLHAYRGTAEYAAQLEKKINAAQELAQGQECTVYLDAADEPLLQELQQRTGCRLTVSAEPFGGGIRALIPSRNLLVDETFDSKLEEERERYSL